MDDNVTSESLMESKLEKARRDLLDLTARNKLLNTPRSKSRSSRLEIIDELSDEVFRILVTQKKTMTFLSIPDENEDEPDDEALLFQPEDDDDSDGPAERHVDTKLQTSLTSKKLQTRLLALHRDARTFEEEQGVNSLYVAIGFLKWYEHEKSDLERFAPLILVPVGLDRKSANAKFRLQYTEDEIATNLSLKEKLQVEFGIDLPELSVEDDEDISPTDYFAKVQKAVTSKPRWEILGDDMVLWFFSFSKFLMYVDLRPETWPDGRNISEHGVIDALLHGGFGSEPPICGENDNIDGVLQPLDMTHVMDADSSQTLAIEEVNRGSHLVIQGPPGTGKSQTITNLVASAVRNGKKVLFVAEKMAALDVVKRRLDSVQLGDLCLELHSHKSNKRDVLQELERTLGLGRPKVDGIAEQASELMRFRDQLNQHATLMHTQLQPSSITPYQVIGKLVELSARHVPPTDFALDDALSWSRSDVRERSNRLDDLAVHLNEIGDPRQHPWRGVRQRNMIPADVERLSSSIPAIMGRLERLVMITGELAELLQFGIATTPLDSSTLAQYAQRLTKAPKLDRRAIASLVWNDQQPAIASLVEVGAELTRSKQAIGESLAEVAWTTDVAETRRNLAAYGRSWFRVFNRKYREARATLLGILNGPPPKSNSEQLTLLDSLMLAQKHQHSIDNSAALGQEAFGNQWQGEESNWDHLNKIVNWESECRQASIPGNFREVLACLEDGERVNDLVRRLGADLKPMFTEVQELFKLLDLSVRSSFGTKDIRTVSMTDLNARLKQWRDNRELLSKWMSYFARWSTLRDLGMKELGTRIDAGAIAANEASDRFLMAYYEELVREVYRKFPHLAEFDGSSHESVLAQFQKLDRERLELAVHEVALAHYEGLPSGDGSAGEMKVLRHEMKKKRRHMSVRRLLREAGHVIQAIKPVFMMSPISVAQFLEPGILEFDLLLIDEASQVLPVDALGAIARCKQIVVVGDDRQLPPTSFFSRVASGNSEDEDAVDDFQTGDLESILALCEAQGVPQRMLQWHYRSRHQSLIAVSNYEFYESRLFVVPSPMLDGGEFGLRFHFIPNGVFDRGGSATNRIEARQVADVVMQHAREYPEKSLGVGTFSVKQRDAILDELELRRRESPELESVFATGGNEPFFVKNLENIQGDERDVIYISIGYAKDAAGNMSMGFGPLSTDGGHRRLNVLISRAKERCEVFSSITAHDIDLNRAKSRGAQALKTFLTYAETGQLGIAEATGKDFDSDFEMQVCRAVESCGYQLEPQVGDAGFFIDLAVIDPDVPGRYLIAIECDGASYHSSRSARDRDRLRQQILEDRGWIIHRIWSTDWFKRPEEQLRKTLAAVEEAKVTWASRNASTGSAESKPAQQLVQSLGREAESIELDPMPSIETRPYQETNLSVDTSMAIHETPLPYLEQVVAKIVEIEGPIHLDEVARRVVSIWGLKRTGTRIVNTVESALAEACLNRRVSQDGLFFNPSSPHPILIRNREVVTSSGLRKPENLPPVEIRQAISAVVRTHLGIPIGDVAVEVGRLFGFRSTSPQLKQTVQDEIDYLVVDVKTIEVRNDKLFEGTADQQRIDR
jgi:very-short-patch-repair endonuclease/DNA polymerase III delta prime subunit